MLFVQCKLEYILQNTWSTCTTALLFSTGVDIASKCQVVQLRGCYVLRVLDFWIHCVHCPIHGTMGGKLKEMFATAMPRRHELTLLEMLAPHQLTLPEIWAPHQLALPEMMALHQLTLLEMMAPHPLTLLEMLAPHPLKTLLQMQMAPSTLLTI